MKAYKVSGLLTKCYAMLKEYSENFLEFIEIMCGIAIPSHIH